MTDAPQKTLGQIAHEAGERIGAWSRTWAHMGQEQRDDWEVVAAAVAAAEREECAALLDENAQRCGEESMMRLILETNAAAIRARKG